MKRILAPFILIALIGISTISCNLTLVNLNTKEQNLFPKNEIPYSAANFGKILYGKTLVSKLVVAEPLDGCGELKNINSTGSPFLLMERGNCTFVQKVRYAQLAGASMAIIYDNLIEDSNSLVMIADGHMSDITIPSVIIKKSDGENLATLAKERLTSSTEEKYIAVMMVFDVKKTASIDYKFFITTSSRQSFKLIRDFEPYFRVLEKSAKFEPHYAIWYCPGCSADSQKVKEMCVSGGKYCFPNPTDGKTTGKELVLEDLKQICIYKDNTENWWRYMEKFDLDCIDYSDMKTCSTKIMGDLSIDKEKIDKCIDDSFEKAAGETTNMELNDNSILKKERISLNEYNILQWPEVIINGNMFRGNLEADLIFNAICASLKDAPEECKLSNPVPADSDGVSVGVVLLIVAISIVVIFLLMIFVYRRMLKREISQNMNTQINDMVSQYMAFYDKKEDQK